MVIADHAAGLPVLRTLSLCTCCRHYPGAAAGRITSLVHPTVSAFPERVVGSACASSFSRLARRSLALRPAHSRRHLILLCHKFLRSERSWHCSLTARASRQLLGEGDDQASAHGGDRIWNVALGPQRRRRGVGNRRERQVLRTAWRDEVLRGESSPARRPRSRKSRCTSWRDGGSHAILGLRNVRARPPA